MVRLQRLQVENLFRFKQTCVYSNYIHLNVPMFDTVTADVYK